jgi:nicotinamide-nucleotide amidase
MRVEVLTIGDELLLGFTVDTNGAFLARTLAAAGVEIAWRSSVGDEPDAIARAVRESLERTGAVITTGGLGPTSDDMTKPSIAKVFGRGMYLDEKVLAAIEARFQRMGYRGPMPVGNRQQAMIPEGARILENRHGSAPGSWLEDVGGRWVAMLPGVPREMRAMTLDTILPLLQARVGDTPRVVTSVTLRTTGIGESALAELLGNERREIDGMPLAYLPGWAGTDLRLTVRGQPADVARGMLDRAAADVRARAAKFIYGEDDQDLAAVVLGLARERSLHIATAESCTGGMLGARLTAIPGSSDVYVGGVVAYSNEIKISALGVRRETIETHGAVSEETARELALGAGQRFGAEIGVGITGVAGPGGGTPEKPVGLVWLAVRHRDQFRAAPRNYVGDREEIRQRATQGALDLLRRMMLDLD